MKNKANVVQSIVDKVKEGKTNPKKLLKGVNKAFAAGKKKD